MTKAYKASYIASHLNGTLVGDDIEVNNFSRLADGKFNSISFYNDQKLKKDFINTKAGVVIIKKQDIPLRKKSSIIVEDPYLAFAKVSSLFILVAKQYSINKKTHISVNANLGENISLGAHSSIGNNTKIENGVEIGANTTIGDNVYIGENTIIHSNITIESNVVIGKNCEIFSGARIGTAGFGYARENDGSWLKIPQVGSVVIGNNVDIGANTTIDRGAIENTQINDGVKIDNLVQIAHNCVIGENTIIAGCVGIAGSTIIGKNCMIGGASMIKGHIEIADGTIISGGTGIAKSIKEKGKRFTSIFPYNIEHKDWLRISSNLKKLGK